MAPENLMGIKITLEYVKGPMTKFGGIVEDIVKDDEKGLMIKWEAFWGMWKGKTKSAMIERNHE